MELKNGTFLFLNHGGPIYKIPKINAEQWASGQELPQSTRELGLPNWSLCLVFPNANEKYILQNNWIYKSNLKWHFAYTNCTIYEPSKFFLILEILRFGSGNIKEGSDREGYRWFPVSSFSKKGVDHTWWYAVYDYFFKGKKVTFVNFK
jgi:hypothetical protein